ncbi:hypothetical protein [Acinetobacter pittii]|uniref:hypothetical protein n=1 Tax=Acinetobacter pittii TaxID=48296 RepID=UPI00053BDCAE|nr:hypothetical protein [Acinetobacter pittii]MDR0067238.1 hypothetical protein [Acinetobacter sp. 11520]MDU6100500.1 hypothetical protein [Acinetobacter sp.]MBM0876630.1 hypothetical protein [Acinetobacter pittii]MCU4617856.1 hypothetical protein [Acinetobacter pittii]OCY63409.1 hypothetical protein BFR82_06270 [Acinetobacter pittii]
MNPIQLAIEAVGGRTNASLLLGISYNAVRKMEEKGVLPRTDYTEETSYSKILADNSEGKITKEWLLDKANPKHLQSNKPS